MKPILRLLTLLWLLLALYLHAADKPRLLVLTDIENEPDEAMSMVRFLTYCNHWDVEGLIATTSVGCDREAHPAWPFTLYRIDLAEGMKFTAEVIDTWNMSTTPVDNAFVLKKRNAFADVKEGCRVAPNDPPSRLDIFGVCLADKDGRSVPLPGNPYTAIRIKRVKE